MKTRLVLFAGLTAAVTACGSNPVVLQRQVPFTPAPSTSAGPTTMPTGGTTTSPTATPTGGGTASPTATPTGGGTASPTATPTGGTASPTATPTGVTTTAPTATPTATVVPTATPTSTSTPSMQSTAPPNATAFTTCGAGNSGSITCDNRTTTAAGSFAQAVFFTGSNATGTNPTLASNFYLNNPGSYAVTGSVVAASQSVLSDMPSQLTFQTSAVYEFQYGSTGSSANFSPGSSYTCTIFDGSTLIGSGTSNAAGQSSNGQTSANASCAGQYPANTAQSATGTAYVNLPATFNTGDTYTFVISH